LDTSQKIADYLVKVRSDFTGIPDPGAALIVDGNI